MKPASKVLLFITVFFVFVLLLGVFGWVETSIKGQLPQNRNLWVGSLFLYLVLSYSAGMLIVALMGKKWKELSLAILSLTVALAVTDFTLQSLRLFPDRTMLKLRGVGSTELHHRYPANSKMYAGLFEGSHIFVETNEDGLRTGYSKKEYLKFADRVVFLGDSYTLGFGVQEKAAFPKVVERLIRQRLGRSDIGVLNAGILSYSPFLSDIQFAKQLISYQPTMVLFVLDATDFGDDVKYEDEATIVNDQVYFDVDRISDEKFRNSENDYGAVFQLCRPYLQYPYWRFTGRDRRAGYRYYEFNLKIGNSTETNLFFVYRHPLELTKPYLMKTLGHINRIATRAKSVGARFVLVVTPRYHHWNTKECPENWEKESYATQGPYHDEYFRFFDEIRPELEYPVYNMLPAFQSTDEFPLVFKADPHWNERGHAFVGRVLADYLVENEFVK